MKSLSKFVAPLVVAGLLAACGGSSGGDDALPEVRDFDPALAAALADSEAVESVRIESFSSQRLVAPELGMNTVTEIDESRPAAVIESDGSGSSHQVLDLSPTFAALADANPGLGSVLDDVVIEMWSTPDRLVVDTTAYQAIEDLNPGQLGVFAPGVFEVDLAALGEDGDDEIARLLIGSSTPNLQVISTGLLERLQAPVETGSSTYTGTMSYADLIEIQGSSVDDIASSSAAGIASSMGLDAQQIADLYAGFYRSTEIEVALTLSEASLLERVEYDLDLSDIFVSFGEILLEGGSALGPVPESEQEEISKAFSTATFTQSNVLVFAPTADMEIVVPEGDLEDRTAEAVAFFRESGLDLASD